MIWPQSAHNRRVGVGAGRWGDGGEADRFGRRKIQFESGDAPMSLPELFSGQTPVGKFAAELATALALAMTLCAPLISSGGQLPLSGGGAHLVHFPRISEGLS